ncbi:MAG: histidinol dehydrogenase [Ignavibacteriales bacterium]|nr:histidinol dehydrogenase [Ignavibacteriales bacterium]
MKTYELKNLNPEEREKLLKRPAINLDDTLSIVKPILSDIKENGLQAALKYAELYDGFSSDDILVSTKEFESAEINLDEKIKDAIKSAARNIEFFHRNQIPKDYEVEMMPGVRCSREFRAIQNVGLYIPGGNAVLPSTMLMLGIPAKLAGCKRIVVCSPAKDGKINNALLFAAKLIGINEFYKLGGAQAIGLMAYGDANFKKVDKIFGPGNQYVTAAKLLVSIDLSGCTIDMPAGPSEVLIIADESANPAFIAADLLSQAEHGSDSQVILISNSSLIIQQVQVEIAEQIKGLSRQKFAADSLNSSFSLLVENIDDAFLFSNEYAPEHLILHINMAENYKMNVINAGSIFLGEYSPESAGDYASGTNHSLPTYGYAKSISGVSVENFMKSISFQKLTRRGLKGLANTVETLAEVEMLGAHKNAVTIRIKKND